MDHVDTAFARSLVDLTRTAPHDTSVCFKQSSLIYDSRNLLAITAIENGYDQILWLDSDMTFRPDILSRLSDDMERNGLDLVTGLYVKRKSPVIPVLYKRITAPDLSSPDIKRSFEDYLDYPTNSLFPIAGCGFGCVLTSVNLIKRIWERFGPAFSPLFWCGEDISFCYRAKQLNAKLACDSSVRCGHMGTVEFTEDIFIKNRGDNP